MIWMSLIILYRISHIKNVNIGCKKNPVQARQDLNLHQIRYERNVLPLNYKPVKLVNYSDKKVCPINGKKGIRTLGIKIIRSLSRGVPSTTQPPFLVHQLFILVKPLFAPFLLLFIPNTYHQPRSLYTNIISFYLLTRIYIEYKYYVLFIQS